MGANGGGVLEHFGLDQEAVPVLVGTLGKAFGSFGAFVAGSAALIEFLIQKARTYIYTTALPQPVAAATRAALRLLQAESWRRERLHQLSARFRAGAQAAGVALSPIRDPDPAGAHGQRASGTRCPAASAAGAGSGWSPSVRRPCRPGSARLRVTLSAVHTDAEVDALVEALAQVCAERHSIPA